MQNISSAQTVKWNLKDNSKRMCKMILIKIYSNDELIFADSETKQR